MKVFLDQNFDSISSLSSNILPVADKNERAPIKGSLLYNTSTPPDIIHYADGTQWIPLANFSVINEGIGVHLLDDTLPPSAPPPGYKMRSLIPDSTSGNQGISLSISGTGEEVAIGNTLTCANIGPASGPTVAEVFSAKVGNTLQMKKLVAGINITLQNNETNIVIDASPGGNGISGLNNEGGGAEIFDQIIGTTAILRTLIAGTGTSVTQNANNITIANSSPASSVTLTSAGGTETLVNSGTGPSLATKGLTAGAGITLTPSATDITITSTASSVSLTSAGGTETLVNDGTGPSLATKGLTAGAGITLTPSATDITITSTGGGGVSSTDYVFAYDTKIQTIVRPDIFQDVIFGSNAIINGWMHDPNTESFVCATNGIYIITAVLTFSKTTRDDRIVSAILINNDVEISGSQQGERLEEEKMSVVVYLTSIITEIRKEATIKLQFTVNGDNTELTPNIGSSTIGIMPSAKISITRIA